MESNNKHNLGEIRKLYNDTFKEVTTFLKTGQTWRDMNSIEEFKMEVKKFWERSRVWKIAWDNSVFPEEKLDKDFEKIRMNAERLLLDQE